MRGDLNMVNKIGKRIFYDVRNGEILAIVGERSGHIHPTTVEEDIESFPKLQERNRETFDYIDLEYGQYKADFQRATSVAVDLDTMEIVFNFEGIDEEPIYQEPLTEKVERLEKEQLITMTALVEKHEETLALKKMNEELQKMNLVALQGVAELNGEVQKLKKEMEASAD